jgi:hypothetical protein
MSISRKSCPGPWRRSIPSVGALLVTVALLAGARVAAAQDAGADQVFRPVPRCRVIDTRLEGGPLLAGAPRGFDVAGTLAGQGGAADCQVPFGAATVAVVHLQPIDAAGVGHLTAWPFGGTVPPGALVDFTPDPGGTLTGERLLLLCNPAQATCTRDLVIQADGSDTHLVADVTGYFSPVTTYEPGLGVLRLGTTFRIDTAAVQRRVQACPAGSSIQTVGATGAVACDLDDNPAYDVGFGLQALYSGVQLRVNTDEIQRRMGWCVFGHETTDSEGVLFCAQRIKAGRDSAPGACPGETYVGWGSRTFATTPAVFVTPNGLEGVTAPPNSYCVVDDVTTKSFRYCCYGHRPEYVNWIAVVN